MRTKLAERKGMTHELAEKLIQWYEYTIELVNNFLFAMAKIFFFAMYLTTIITILTVEDEKEDKKS